MTAPSTHRMNNLPAPLSSFIGRRNQISEILQLLETHRLVTLAGPGGCGKTRLALEVAAGALGHFDDGACLVELAPLADAALVPQAVAGALGVRDQAGRSILETLSDVMEPKSLLLVLDNCEHLVEACAQFAAAILQACPSLRILATSREPLGVEGEVVWKVPPLSLPPMRNSGIAVESRGGAADEAQSESVQLFMARAKTASPGFALTPGNAAAVAEICRRLDGMPLAIELAAARLRALSVDEIAAHLDDRFQLLNAGSRTAPPRHQTLQAALDWSYALLTEPERKLLQRLSVFAGGCTLEAAEAVCPGTDVPQPEVLDLVTRLVDKSLLLAETARSKTRYRLLETIRHYSALRLSESGEAVLSRDRHLQYFTQLAEAAEPALTASDQAEWLERLELEHDNVRLALGWALEGPVSAPRTEQIELGLRLAAALTWFWEKRGHWNEGGSWLRRALAAGAGLSMAKRVKAELGAGILAVLQSDLDEAQASFDRCLTAYREQQDKRGIADSLFWTAWVAEERGEWDRAAQLQEESLGLYRSLGYRLGIADALQGLGEVAYFRGDFARAASALEEALNLARESEDRWRVAGALKYLGVVAFNEGDHERASALLNECMGLNRELGDARQIGSTLYVQGLAAHARGSQEAARNLVSQALVLLQQVQDRIYTAHCLEALAGIAVAERDFGRAARLFGAAESLRRSIHASVAWQTSDYERDVDAVRRELGPAAFASMWKTGSDLTVQEAIDEALQVRALPPGIGPLTTAGAARQMFGGLTAREREVAARIAQGKSNRDIAEAMTVGVRTVETYVTRILHKLGFESRVQIATWAIEKGLASPGGQDQLPDL